LWSLQSFNRIDSQKSPFDGDFRYWWNHLGFRLMRPSSLQREYLFKKQKGLCLHCKNPFGQKICFMLKLIIRTAF